MADFIPDKKISIGPKQTFLKGKMQQAIIRGQKPQLQLMESGDLSVNLAFSSQTLGAAVFWASSNNLKL